MKFAISDDYIELYKLIKAAGLVDSGGEAKMLIAEGHVNRNGEQELRKRAKIKVGERITIADAAIEVTAKE